MQKEPYNFEIVDTTFGTALAEAQVDKRRDSIRSRIV